MDRTQIFWTLSDSLVLHSMGKAGRSRPWQEEWDLTRHPRLVRSVNNTSPVNLAPHTSMATVGHSWQTAPHLQESIKSLVFHLTPAAVHDWMIKMMLRFDKLVRVGGKSKRLFAEASGDELYFEHCVSLFLINFNTNCASIGSSDISAPFHQLSFLLFYIQYAFKLWNEIVCHLTLVWEYKGQECPHLVEQLGPDWGLWANDLQLHRIVLASWHFSCRCEMSSAEQHRVEYWLK